MKSALYMMQLRMTLPVLSQTTVRPRADYRGELIDMDQKRQQHRRQLHDSKVCGDASRVRPRLRIATNGIELQSILPGDVYRAQ